MPDTNFSDITILVVEDSPTQALLLKEELEGKGFNVSCAKNGMEGLRMAQEHPPTLMISDIDMPEMNGYELCKKIRSDENLSTIPFIILTSLSDTMDVIRAIECGANYFFTKPFNMPLLLTYLHDILENRKIPKAAERKIKFSFQGVEYVLPANPEQIIDLFISTYLGAQQKNLELKEANFKVNQAHKELTEKNEELAKLNVQKNQFLGMAAHDLRNPLGIIQGFSEMLLHFEKNIDEKSLKKIQHIKNTSSYMLHLVNELLDISVIESGKVHLSLSKQNLADLIKNNITLNESMAERKQITLAFASNQNTLEVLCDPLKIEQVLNNLITNAIKFSKSGTTIEIELSKTDREAIFAVKDQGPGISPAEKERIFHSFVKGSAKATGGEASTGLGLAIAKKIIAEHKGRIWIESELEKGSTFFVALPL